MQSFQAGVLYRELPDHRLARTLRALGEAKGREALWYRQSPEVLETLQQAAVIESTESSNRIEGVEAPHERIEALAEGRVKPRNRSEQEIAGYREVLGTIHLYHDSMPFTPNLVLQLHRDLFRYDPGRGGRWKSVDNTITERGADGVLRERFRPVPAFATPGAMEGLHAGWAAAMDDGSVDPLLITAAYVLDFLCIHPFLDGNGRMARLLTLLLLYQSGYQVGRYIGLERIVEETRDSFYEALFASSRGWHEGEHLLAPWTNYLLGVVVTRAYAEMGDRVGSIRTGRGAKQKAVRAVIERLPPEFRYADIERGCPAVSRPTIERVLRQMREEGLVTCVRPGRGAVWRRRG